MAEYRLAALGPARDVPVALETPSRETLAQGLCAALLVATIAFNPALAWANAHLAPVTPALVSAVQAAIVLGALAMGALQPLRTGVRWLALAWLLAMGVVLTGALRGALEPKVLGDVLLIPAFILLGTRLHRATLVGAMALMQGMLVAVGLWELAFPGQYGRFFDVLGYYVQTRGFDAEDFWAGGQLFLSSERPGGRILLDGLNLHRGSSLFLEPVSLGNWSVLAALFAAMLWRDLSRGLRLYFITTIGLLLVVCDGRLAMGVLALFALYLPLARRLPDRLSVAYLPVMLGLLAAAGALGLLEPGGDSFTGRLGIGIGALQAMSLERLLGLSRVPLSLADAGWADVVQSQSLFLPIALWLVLSLTGFGKAPENRVAKHGILLFLMLSLPISNSILSVKTAAAMWAFYGFAYARSRRTDPAGAAALSCVPALSVPASSAASPSAAPSAAGLLRAGGTARAGAQVIISAS